MQKDIGEVGPQLAWDILSNDPTARLVDVRTRAEWSFVGVPDLSTLSGQTLLVEWKSFPQMQRNEAFVSELLAGLDGAPAQKLLFICRSGARSLEAARLVASEFADQDNAPECVNVAEGFEGNLDLSAHRGQSNGWKAAGLPWRQS
ncbi:MAG: rhodanese-like domain-containing protein [Paracoccaceae bacterium]